MVDASERGGKEFSSSSAGVLEEGGVVVIYQLHFTTACSKCILWRLCKLLKQGARG